MRFTQFYNTARCWPTRSVILTGYYPQQIRMDPPHDRLPDWTSLLPHLLQPMGCRSYHAGKWQVTGAPHPVADGGFDRSYWFEDWDRYLAGWDEVRQQRWQRLRQRGIVHCDLARLDTRLQPRYFEPSLLDTVGPGEVPRTIAWNELTAEQQRFQATKTTINGSCSI